MLIDLTVLVTEYASKEVSSNVATNEFGHMGTHFDVLDKEFPLSFVKRKGIVFNVKNIFDEEIDIKHIDLSLVEPEMFVAFYSGFIEKHGYGTKEYFTNHPHLSNDLIDALLEKKISIIGVDFAGIRRGSEHPLKDQYCADRGVFIVENLCNLGELVQDNKSLACTMHTYPVKFAGMTGLPCRVVTEI
ncbi:MAG: cyclase family protein [Gammaproteobacteria bacterium]|nr:cyclase family protein [Bacteroidales bacterium]MCK5644042.1 cyclase family protein [Gammaproteobacteria bacterium]